jgi:hypothetical protein
VTQSKIWRIGHSLRPGSAGRLGLEGLRGRHEIPLRRPAGAKPARPRVSPPEPVACLATIAETRPAERRRASMGAVDLLVEKSGRGGTESEVGEQPTGCECGTHEEDGPVTREVLASPRGKPDWRRASDPSPTRRTSARAPAAGSEQALASSEQGTLSDASTSGGMSLQLLKVVERAARARRTVPLTGPSDRCARSGPRRSAHAKRCGDRCG